MDVSKLTKVIAAFAKDSENYFANYFVAQSYEELGQTSAAIGFYLRAAERTNDKNLAYECLLKIGLCFEKQTKRDNTVRVFYKHAMLLLPKRPEAYFLLARFYERKHDMVAGYMFADMGLKTCDFNQKPLKGSVEYPGDYGLAFEKMVTAWWWGKHDECRQLLVGLRDLRGILDESHYNAVQNNLISLGVTGESFAVRKYDNSQYKYLRHKFLGSEKVHGNYSQVYQDLFVLSMQQKSLLLGRHGKYLEIGTAGPIYGNNTKLLEELDWEGVGIEWNKELAKSYADNRRNPVYNLNALEVDYVDILTKLAPDGIIHYLQLDCEPAKTTYDIMMKIPFSMFKFAVITYEHDDYVDMSGQYRRLSREFLTAKGYELVVSDISPDGVSNFEDWWVHPELVNPEALATMRDVSKGTKHATDYMLPGLRNE